MKGYTRFSPNSIYIFVYNIELGLSLFGEGVVWGWLGVVWGVCMGFFVGVGWGCLFVGFWWWRGSYLFRYLPARFAVFITNRRTRA